MFARTPNLFCNFQNVLNSSTVVKNTFFYTQKTTITPSYYKMCKNYRRISLRHSLNRKCRKIVKFVSIAHSELTFGMAVYSLLPSCGKSVNQCWKEMASSPTERSWCVLKFARCKSFVAVQRAWVAHRMHLRSL
jgi:hypothetical protein